MKIKEVIEKTKLTDRAIRLYIDNGLVSPGIEESYSGRKNIEFSENDVERLNQIALLRKAGFSISDIKTIISDDEKIEEIVRKFIGETDEEIRSKAEVVERLKSISFDEKISLKILCEKLSETVEEITVPKEDLNAPRSYKITRKILQILAASGLTLSAGIIVTLVVYVVCFYKYYCPTVMTIAIAPLSLGGLIIVAVMCISVLNIFREKRTEKENRKTDVRTSVIVLIIAAIIFLPSMVTSFNFGMFGGSSLTTNPKNYLDVDNAVEYDMDIILKIFPGRIPSSVRSGGRFDDSVKYYYYYEDVMSAKYNIMAEWRLNDKEYEKAKKDVEKDGDYVTTQRGDWVCMHFAFYSPDHAEEEKPYKLTETGERSDYNCLIFAYNDKENKVRYIASKHDYGDHYYKSLDW